jgi:hypothetical protein
MKKPMLARGPKPSIAIMQPQAITKPGVRQEGAGETWGALLMLILPVAIFRHDTSGRQLPDTGKRAGDPCRRSMPGWCPVQGLR